MDQIRFIFQNDPFFKSFPVMGRKHFCPVRKYTQGIWVAVFPKGDVSIPDSKKETQEDQGKNGGGFCHIYRLHGPSISSNLKFIKNLGLSFSFGVCYNTMKWCYALMHTIF